MLLKVVASLLGGQQMADVLTGNDEQAGGQREVIAHCALTGGE